MVDIMAKLSRNQKRGLSASSRHLQIKPCAVWDPSNTGIRTKHVSIQPTVKLLATRANNQNNRQRGLISLIG